jgi:HEAT repeat protein
MTTRFEQPRRLAACLLVLATVAPVRAADLDTIRDTDPPINAGPPAAPVAKFHPRLKELWLEALARPEADLKRQAADAIARAHALGMPGLADTAPRLVAELEAKDAHPVVKLAVARALVALDARPTAAALAAFAQAGGPDAARLLEPVLAKWDHAPMRAVWLARIADPKAPRGALVLAVRAAGTAKLTDAAPPLRRLALDPRGAGDVRLEAARSLALLQPTGLEADAQALAADPSPQKIVARLVAATLLGGHRGPAAEALLLQLAADREPAVAAVAVGRLLELDPTKLAPLLDGLAGSPDAGLRRLAVRGLAALKTPKGVTRLGPLLDDPHRDVRVLTRESLVGLADVETLKGPVRDAAMTALAGAGPAGREQAAILVGTVRHEPAADGLVRLLAHERAEVRVAAAWALRRLAVPATAGPILERVKAVTGKAHPLVISESGAVRLFRDVEHLIEALGVMRYRPAVPVLTKYLPVPPTPPPPGVVNAEWVPPLRAAAIWSLGRIHAAEAPPDFATAVIERLEDGVELRVMAAVTLGRMRVKEAVPALRRYYQSETDSPVSRRACAWALEQITTVPHPPPPSEPRSFSPGQWFLEPIDQPPRR